MEQYKEKLKVQNWILIISCVILAVFTALGFLAELGIVNLTPAAGDRHWQSRWRGFISGASMGMLALMLFGLVRNILAMKDEKKLKKLYIQEHDERMAQIYIHSRSAAMSTCLIFGLVAIVVAGYFSVTVSLTILCCVLAGSLLSFGFKLYYSKKY